MNKIYYPAVFTAEDVGFSVKFPDLPGCYTEGDTIEEAYEMSVSAIGLYSQTEGGEFNFPKASAPNEIKLNSDEVLVLIEFDPIEYLKKTGSKSVKKTLTIPAWLNAAALEKKINFSKTLQEALIAKIQA